MGYKTLEDNYIKILHMGSMTLERVEPPLLDLLLTLMNNFSYNP